MLDYKGILPAGEKLARTISAFANTFGGLIIVGVEDEDDRPRRPCEGIPFREGLKGQVENIIIDNINPVVFVETKVCLNQENNKCFIVIRIPQSNLTPHAVMDSRGIYVRTGQRGKLEEIVHPDQIKWLFDKREKSIKLREQILHKANERFVNFLSWIKEKPSSYPGVLQISVLPIYPKGTLVENKIFEGTFLNDILVHNVRQADFPDLRDKRKYIQDGILLYTYDEQARSFEYIQLGAHGEYLLKTDIVNFELDPTDGTKGNNTLYFYRLLFWLDALLASSLKFYKKIGYWGNLYIDVSISNLKDVKVDRPGRRSDFFNEEDRFPLLLDNEIKITKEVLINEILNNRKDFMIRFANELAWSLDIKGITYERLEQELASIGSIMIQQS